jgi:hypothetical protein
MSRETCDKVGTYRGRLFSHKRLAAESAPANLCTKEFLRRKAAGEKMVLSKPSISVDIVDLNAGTDG